MRLICLLIFAFQLFYLNAIAQEKFILGGSVTIADLEKDPASRPSDKDDEKGLVSGRAYAAIAGERFSYLVTGDKDVATLGNSASIDVTTATAAVAFGGIVHGKERGPIGFFSGGATGGAGQNIISLFSADKFNSSFEARGTYSLMARRLGTHFYFLEDSKSKQLAARHNAYSSLATQRYKYQLNERLNQAEAEALGNDAAEAARITKKPASDRTNQEVQFMITYQTKRTKLNTALQKQTTEAERFGDDAKFQKAVDDTVFTVDKNAEWSTITLGWLDIFASGKLQKINLYNGAAPYFAHRLTESRETYYKFGLAYNFSWASDKFKPILNGIYRLEIAYSKNNNAADLAPFDVTTEQKADSANFSRKATKKVNSYEKSQFVINDYLDYRIDILKEVTRNHRAYVRLVYNYSVPINQTATEGKIVVPNTHNVTLGYLLAFNNKDKTKSTLNLQPYIKLKDFTNEYKQNLSLLRRSEIGILTVFPLGLATPKAKE